MTECERLIANGTFTRDFFKPEVRCDFLVDEKRKKIWAVEIGLLLEFDRICKLHELRYWLTAGTLLGAIRHKGFIPWDDDTDLYMPLEDYEKLMRLSSEFKYPYFLQTNDTDPESYFSFAKIRDSSTTGASAMFAYQRMNHGIFLDIYPLYSTSLDRGPQAFAEIDKLNRELSTFMRMKNPNLDEANRQRVATYCGRNPRDIYDEVSEVARNAGDDGVHCAQFLSTITSFKRNCYVRSDFDETIMVDFEGFKFPAPKAYDSVLKVLYGDYLKLPPVEERIGHYGSIFEPDIPYESAMKETMQN